MEREKIIIYVQLKNLSATASATHEISQKLLRATAILFVIVLGVKRLLNTQSIAEVQNQVSFSRRRYCPAEGQVPTRSQQ